MSSQNHVSRKKGRSGFLFRLRTFSSKTIADNKKAATLPSRSLCPKPNVGSIMKQYRRCKNRLFSVFCDVFVNSLFL